MFQDAAGEAVIVVALPLDFVGADLVAEFLGKFHCAEVVTQCLFHQIGFFQFFITRPPVLRKRVHPTSTFIISK